VHLCCCFQHHLSKLTAVVPAKPADLLLAACGESRLSLTTNQPQHCLMRGVCLQVQLNTSEAPWCPPTRAACCEATPNCKGQVYGRQCLSVSRSEPCCSVWPPDGYWPVRGGASGQVAWGSGGVLGQYSIGRSGRLRGWWISKWHAFGEVGSLQHWQVVVKDVVSGCMLQHMLKSNQRYTCSYEA
jgi:hypothetical protein